MFLSKNNNTHTHTHKHIYIYIYIQASFVKDNGTQCFILFYFFKSPCYFSSLEIYVVKELSNIFYPGAFGHIFCRHQE